MTEPVIMEVLAGARSDEREHQLRRLLLRFDLLRLDPAADLEAAARIYRECRRAGITPRGMIDCLIVSVARRNDAILLARDRDLTRVASTMGVRMDEASR